MKYNYTKENYSTANSGNPRLKEVVFTYQVNGHAIKKFIFIKAPTDAIAIKKAKHIIEIDKKTGKLDKYTKKFISQLKGPKKKIILFSAGAVVVAGLAVGAVLYFTRDPWQEISAKRANEIIKNIDKVQGTYDKETGLFGEKRLFKLFEKNGNTGSFKLASNGGALSNSVEDLNLDFNINTKKKTFYAYTDKEVNSTNAKNGTYIIFRDDKKVGENIGGYIYSIKDGGKPTFVTFNEGSYSNIYNQYQDGMYDSESELQLAKFAFGRDVPKFGLNFNEMTNSLNAGFKELTVPFEVIKGLSSGELKTTLDELKENKALDSYSYKFKSCNNESVGLDFELKGYLVNPSASTKVDATLKSYFYNSFLDNYELKMTNASNAATSITIEMSTKFKKISMPDYSDWPTEK